jgi:hypothetical protein
VREPSSSSLWKDRSPLNSHIVNTLEAPDYEPPPKSAA